MIVGWKQKSTTWTPTFRHSQTFHINSDNKKYRQTNKRTWERNFLLQKLFIIRRKWQLSFETLFVVWSLAFAWNNASGYISGYCRLAYWIYLYPDILWWIRPSEYFGASNTTKLPEYLCIQCKTPRYVAGYGYNENRIRYFMQKYFNTWIIWVEYMYSVSIFCVKVNLRHIDLPNLGGIFILLISKKEILEMSGFDWELTLLLECSIDAIKAPLPNQWQYFFYVSVSWSCFQRSKSKVWTNPSMLNGKGWSA